MFVALFHQKYMRNYSCVLTFFMSNSLLRVVKYGRPSQLCSDFFFFPNPVEVPRLLFLE